MRVTYDCGRQTNTRTFFPSFLNARADSSTSTGTGPAAGRVIFRSGWVGYTDSCLMKSRSRSRSEGLGREWINSNSSVPPCLEEGEGGIFLRSCRNGATPVPVDICQSALHPYLPGSETRLTMTILSYCPGRMEQVGIGPLSPTIPPGWRRCIILPPSVSPDLHSFCLYRRSRSGPSCGLTSQPPLLVLA